MPFCSGARKSWRPAAAEAGLVFGMVRTNEEFLKEPQNTSALQDAADHLGKNRGEQPIPLQRGGSSPLEGIRALGLGACDCRAPSDGTSPITRRRPQHLEAP